MQSNNTSDIVRSRQHTPERSPSPQSRLPGEDDDDYEPTEGEEADEGTLGDMVPRRLYDKVVAERDRYRAALRQLQQAAHAALDPNSRFAPSKKRPRQASSSASPPPQDDGEERVWKLTRIRGQGLLPGNPDLQVYRVDRGEDVVVDRFLFRPRDGLELLNVAENLLDGCSRRIMNLLAQKERLSSCKVRGELAVARMLRHTTGSHGMCPKGFRNTTVWLVTFEGLVMLAADLYISYVLGGSALMGIAAEGKANPSNRRAQLTAVEAAMTPALSWLTDPDAPLVPDQDWTEPRK